MLRAGESSPASEGDGSSPLTWEQVARHGGCASEKACADEKASSSDADTPSTRLSEEHHQPLPFEKVLEYSDVVREKAARQFLAIWERNRHRSDPEQRWGEELEYFLVDLEGGVPRVALCAEDVLHRLGAQSEEEVLQRLEFDVGGEDPTTGAGWRTEYGAMMVEGVTYPAYTWSLEDVLKVEPALAWRRQQLQQTLTRVRPTARVVTMTAFPLLGTPGSTWPNSEPEDDGHPFGSTMVSKRVLSPHPRYHVFTENLCKRKGCKVAAVIPREGVEPEQRLSPEAVARLPFALAERSSQERDPIDGHIFMDSPAFGACQCCTQCTFLARNLEEARHLTDQFLVLAPLFLALTASTPFLRGLVADTDTRWEVFKQAWDDRREDELGSAHASRCSPSDLFIGAELAADREEEESLNDVGLTVHEATQGLLRGAGVDGVLGRHVAHVLAKDPLMLYEERLGLDDLREGDHWEQMNHSSWGTVRFKPPLCAAVTETPEGQSLGWRVEFRSADVQLTDFENAALASAVRLLAQVLVEEHVDLRIPVSLCNANDAMASQRNAASEALFWFRDATTGLARRQPLREILSGKDGIFTTARAWLDRRFRDGVCSQQARDLLLRYLALFDRRATGDLPTGAAFLRARLRRHPRYAQDGAVPAEFVHDLCLFAAEVNQPNNWPEELLGRRDAKV